MIVDPTLTPPATPSLSSADSLPDYSTVLHSPNPPRYTRGNTRPLQPITYTFSPWAASSSTAGEGSTLLLAPPPPGRSAPQEPVYRVSTHMSLNPFLPLSYVTQVHRAGPYDSAVDGELVGQFDISLHQKRAVLTVGDTTTRVGNVLSSIDSSLRHWRWSFHNIILRWDCRTHLDDGSPMCICYTPTSPVSPTSPNRSQDHQLASFVPPSPEASPPLPPAVLTVFPAGHEEHVFDHIVLSALVVERWLVRGM
ncbi:hypothetical protein Hypma_014522 [Hypsizygus marmoreus]|uniref:Uncharacterized protein n=1 Tax=Hypsizygus marmoreus TaxID=39966 RepID=A0A369JBX7_HYPMA|nr:hypothetical protein Hypma_014522 [Hypsizygus marmoreus]